MPKQYTFSLTAEEQASLRALVQQRRATSPQLVRAQCLLAVATNGLGWTDAPSGQAYGVSTPMA
jgi:hypothetical protein